MAVFPETYGRVIGYILSSQNGGTASYDTVSDAKNWASALRILYNTVSSHGAASVYMELDGGWEDDSGLGQNNRALIETAARLTKDGGDFNWGVVTSPNPENKALYRSWLDTDTPVGYEAEHITSKNITTLCAFLARSENAYEGSARRIILLDKNDGSNISYMEEQVAAAEYVSTYYKINTRECAAVECLSVGAVYSYNDVFSLIDTERTAECSEFALDVIGINEWRELFGGYDESLIAVRSVVTDELGHTYDRDASEYTLFGLSGNDPMNMWTQNLGITGLKYGQSDDGTINGGTRLIDGAVMTAKVSSPVSVILGAVPSYPLDLSQTQTLSFSLQLSSLPQNVTGAVVKLYVYSGDSRYEASGVAHGGTWNDFTADISIFAGSGRRIDRIRLVIEGEDGADISDAVIYLSEFTLRSLTLSSFELDTYFRTQREEYFSEPQREYDLKTIIIPSAIAAAAFLLLVIRRIAPMTKKYDEDDFTNMELWK